MNLLLDTHILIWALASEAKLSKDVLGRINNPKNTIYYSVASIWEVTIKNIKNPQKVPFSGRQLADCCEDAGFNVLPVINKHIFMLPTLDRSKNAAAHSDPFDRLLISQAKSENLMFITHDSLLKDYQESCILLV